MKTLDLATRSTVPELRLLLQELDRTPDHPLLQYGVNGRGIRFTSKKDQFTAECWGPPRGFQGPVLRGRLAETDQGPIVSCSIGYPWSRQIVWFICLCGILVWLTHSWDRSELLSAIPFVLVFGLFQAYFILVGGSYQEQEKALRSFAVSLGEYLPGGDSSG
jgi:hypothetical protein